RAAPHRGADRARRPRRAAHRPGEPRADGSDAGDRPGGRRPTQHQAAGAVRDGGPGRRRGAGHLHGAAQAPGPGPGAAPRPRRAVPRRAHLRARPGRHPRRHRADRLAGRRARAHRRAVHPLPRGGRPAGRPDGGAAPRRAPRVRPAGGHRRRAVGRARRPPGRGRAAGRRRRSGAAGGPRGVGAGPAARGGDGAGGRPGGAPSPRPGARGAGRPGLRGRRSPALARGRLLRGGGSHRRPGDGRGLADRAEGGTGGGPMTTADPAAPAAARPPEPARARRARRAVIRAIVAKDLIAVRRAKAVVIPMLAVPVLLMVVLPFGVGLAARGQDGGTDLRRILDSMPGDLAEPILSLPQHEQLVVLVNGYLLAPLFLIVPLMVSAVLAADAFAGEKERKTLESLLHLPIPDRDLFVAKLLTAFLPAVAVSWIGFAAFCLVANGVAWPVMHRVFVPTQLWLVMIFWLGPAVAMLG